MTEQHDQHEDHRPPPVEPREDYRPPPVEPRNAFAIAALALGLVGVLFGLIPLTGFIAVGLGIVGVILALSNRGRLRRGTSTARRTTWAGLVISLIAIALGIWGIVIVFDVVEQIDEDLQEIDTP